ncbi:beta-phosphoglucomutase, partial [Clostridium botulinum]|nr:beta-phosphoglucomutase [Clostridium botulinum]
GLEDSGAGIKSINAAGELSIGIGNQLMEADVRFADTSEVSLKNIKAKLG